MFWWFEVVEYFGTTFYNKPHKKLQQRHYLFELEGGGGCFQPLGLLVCVLAQSLCCTVSLLGLVSLTGTRPFVPFFFMNCIYLTFIRRERERERDLIYKIVYEGQ
uniref:Uncharacterized protein n=1 Tax=Nelumbo nucifera TaxID=4432 RepID=A0A822Z1T5_NELNU|nr:TPA_asm: hypothetical protein HUJ06_006098 [Nelumbo nucifera]